MKEKVAEKIKELEIINQELYNYYMKYPDLVKSVTCEPEDMADMLLEEPKMFMDQLGRANINELAGLQSQIEDYIDNSNEILKEFKNA